MIKSGPEIPKNFAIVAQSTVILDLIFFNREWKHGLNSFLEMTNSRSNGDCHRVTTDIVSVLEAEINVDIIAHGRRPEISKNKLIISILNLSVDIYREN